jgi:thymidylate kinase
MSEPLVLEFVGPSGAGKSTAAEALLERLRQRGYRCTHRHMIGGQELPRTEHFRRLGWYFLSHPRVLQAAARLGLPAAGQGASRLREALRFHVWSYRLTLARQLGNAVVVLDQGVVQEAWGLMVRQPGWDRTALQAAVEDMIRGFPASYALVYFEVDKETATRRIAARSDGESRFDRLTQPEMGQLLDYHAPHLRMMYDTVLRSLELPSLTVDGSRPVEELVTQIAAFAEARLRLTRAS